jgi:hypothetical protein
MNRPLQQRWLRDILLMSRLPLLGEEGKIRHSTVRATASTQDV